MSIGLLIFLVALFAVALVGTFWVFKEEEDKMEEHKEAGDSPEAENKRSEEYEQNWLKTGLGKQAVIYGIALIISIIIGIVIFM